MRRISLVLPFLVVHASLLAAQGADPQRDTIPARPGAGGVKYQETPETTTRAAAESFSELLSGQVPGLVVRRFGGAVGAASRLELRGTSSVQLGGQPLLVVDGVRAISEEAALFLDLGSTTVSSYDDLDPEMVESVTVLPGPAAAARYGPGAANGVLEVRTRRGVQGRPRWRAFAEAGVRGDPGGYPANFQQIGTLAGGGRIPDCDLQLRGGGLCTPKADSLLSYNPLEQSSPFRIGTRLGTGVSVDGGTAALSYAAGAGVERNTGVLEDNGEERVSLRASVGARPLAGVELRVWAAHLRRDLTLPLEGTNPFGVITAGLLGGADPRVNDGYGFLRPGENYLDATHDARRTLGGVEASWEALEWLRVGGRFGIDRADRDELLVLLEAGAPVTRETGARESQVRTGAVEARASFRLSPSLESRTTLEVERASERAELKSRAERVGTDLFSSFESRARRAVVGVSLRQGIDAGPLSVEAAVRRDAPRDQEELWSGSLGAAWALGAPAPWLEGLTLRGAVGRSERSPGSVIGLEGPLFIVGPPCAPWDGCEAFPPQESREAEAGIDARVLGRLDVRLTGYLRDDRDVLVTEPGFDPFQPGTEVRNTGAELSLRTRLLERGRTTWDVEVLAWANRNRVTARPENSVPLISGRTGQRVQEGHPLGAYFARPLLGFEDRDGDGIIEAGGCQSGEARCELELGDTAVYLGSPTPTRGLTLASRLRLGQGVAFSARVEHQGGARLFNAIARFRCTTTLNCREAVDISAPLADQARAAAALLGEIGGYVEEADFVKLREVAVTLSAPSAWSRMMGAAGVELTVAGRNLLTWTAYSGLDPEINSSSRSLFEVWDFASQPLPRTVTTRVEVRF